jgi:glycosyltransferase involved in cell wall biosynthesis
MKIAFCDGNGTVYGYATGDQGAGGNGKWQWLLARLLIQSGWSVVVGVGQHAPEVDLDDRSPQILNPTQERVIEGVRFVRMPQGQFVLAWSKFLMAERPDWWYWQGAEAIWGAMLLVAKAMRIRGIYSSSSDSDLQPRSALTRRQRWWPLYAWGLNAVDRIVVQHHGQLSELSRKLQSKAAVVPGLVLTPERVKLQAERRNYIVWVSFLRQMKRPDLLIEIARKSPELHFVVCGAMTNFQSPGGYGEKLVKEMHSLPNIEYRGHVDQCQVLKIMADAAALLCTSDVEGFPNTFLEAWSVGTPVVSLNIDPGGVISERCLGFVSGTTEQAVSDIRTLVNSPEVFAAISSRSREYIEEVHSNAEVARLFNKAILGVSYIKEEDNNEFVVSHR